MKRAERNGFGKKGTSFIGSYATNFKSNAPQSMRASVPHPWFLINIGIASAKDLGDQMMVLYSYNSINALKLLWLDVLS